MKKPSTSALEHLQQQLQTKDQLAAQLVADQEDNKREQDSLKRAIDVISKNLAESEKDGEELAKQYELTAKQIEHKTACVNEQLGSHADCVLEAIQETQEQLYEKQTQLLELEQALTGEEQLKAITARRDAVKAERRFELLRVKDLKERLAESRALLKEAGALPSDTTAQLAAALALLVLAKERITSSWTAADFVSEQIPFEFPADYEQELAAAYEAAWTANEAALVIEEQYANRRASFDQGIKELAAARVARKTSTVAAAQQSVGGSPVVPSSQVS